MSVDLTEIEKRLRGLLKGEHSSLMLSFNDGHAPNYMALEEYVQSEWSAHTEWVSDEEKAKGIATNSMWTLHFYPDTPVGFHSLSASSLEAIFAALDEQFPDEKSTENNA